MAKPVFRRYGDSVADLDIQFGESARPQLITALLHSCAEVPEEEASRDSEFWTLTVGARTAGLLEIAVNSGITDLEAKLRCHNPECGQEMEISLPVEPLLAMQPAEAKGKVVIQMEEISQVLRKPTGADQLEWQGNDFQDEGDAVRAAIQTLTVDKDRGETELHDEQVRQIDEAMQAADPLVNFRLELICPYCDEKDLYEIDLSETAVSVLAQRQKEIVNTVHRMAQAYHWSEESILAMPPQRRDRYLFLIQRDGAQ